MKKIYLIISLLVCSLIIRAELVRQHFSTADGLSQNTVMSIMQDHKGFMWFGTWDGLNKFDGYEFTIYKSHAGSNNLITNNRIDFLYEDGLHYIWFQTYDDRIHRFDTKKETFYSLPFISKKISDKIRNKDFVESTAGELWVNIIDSVAHICGDKPEITYYHIRGVVNFIVVGKDSSVWIGTSKGLFEIVNGEIKDCTELSQYNVTAAFAADKTIWFGTDNGILFRKSYDKITFERFTMTHNPQINDITVVENRYVIAATNSGIYAYDHSLHQEKNYSISNNPDIQNNNFLHATADSHGLAWIENEQHGIFVLNPKIQHLSHLQTTPDSKYAHNIGSNFVIFEDSDGQVWVNPYGGGFGKYDREKNTIETIPGITNIIHTAFADKSGSIWVSTYAKGVDHISNVQSPFTQVVLDDEVRALYQTQKGNIIVGTKDGRTHIFKGTENIGSLPLDYKVYSVDEDNDGNLWLGTRGDGIIVFDHNNKIIKHFSNNPNDPHSLSDNNIYIILHDSADNMYVGTYGGGLNILPHDSDNFINSNNTLTSYPNKLCNKVRCMALDTTGILWIGTTNGLLQMNLANQEFHYIAKEIGNHNSLGNNDIHSVFIDSENILWVGTFGGGLNKIAKHEWTDYPLTCENYDMTDGLASDIILSIQEDKHHNLWFTSENTITRFDKATGTPQNFNVYKGDSDLSFSECNSLSLANGEMIFAGSNGLCVFNPCRILTSNDAPSIEFTRFQIFNEDVAIGEDSPLDVSITNADKIVLDHDQTVFSIEYAAIDFSNAYIQYAFMLEGFEKQWNYVDDQRKATYTNLPQGTYKFRVISTNAAGLWVNNEHSISIIVKPSFWQTPWAMLLYMLIAILVFSVAYIIFKRYNAMKQNVEIEQKVTDIKLRFFTNISHELRTPLTLISGPVENILSNEYISSSVRDQLEIVKNNSNRMLRMINQILDFRKIQNKKMRLKIQKTNIEELVRQTCANFNKEALDKQIKFNVQVNIPKNTELYIDRDKTDIILYNLLSNAFKFTPSGKSITVRINEHNDFISLEVQDEGVGIEQNKISTLFERFTSNNELNSNFNIIGTGIGLNLVKELVDLHHGYINVKSTRGEGSTFTVMLRKGKDHFNGEADFIIDDNQIETPPTSHAIDTNKLVESVDNSTILVVDDSDDMCAFLTDILGDKFHIESAHDGEEGVEKARSLSPVLIVSDLMMPNKDGLELVNELKSDINTSHIPIILLTAKTAIESRLKAMQYGADDYITKPFSPVYLKARIENILEQRKRLQDSYRQSLINLDPQVETKTTPDQVFLAKLMNVMDKNIDNSELTVDGLLSEMAMGRTVFYNKLKGLTGFSPVEFIREVRIKRAAQLLETGQYSVTEVTYMVGMNDARYFSKCFKAVYGITPSEYRRNMNQ